MSDNDVILLNEILEANKSTAPPSMSDSGLFEYFSSEQVLKDYDLSQDEIMDGVTGGSGDGGIDGFYVIANEKLIEADSDFDRLPSKYSLELYIIQSKTRIGFTEDGLDKILTSLPDLLNLKQAINPALYNAVLIERINIFRDLYKITAKKFPEVKINICYLTKGSTENIDKRVKEKSKLVEKKAEELLSNSIAKVTYFGSRELLDIARATPTATLELRYVDNATKLGQNSYIALVPIKGYFDFLTDSTGRLKKHVFEQNVRDFQGSTQVNIDIRETLSSKHTKSDLDFWWLNNGISILCTQVTIAGDKFMIKDPQIVNGLQTSVAIYEHFRQVKREVADNRALLVRIITSLNDEIRNKVIIATNSQTNLQPGAIRATDEIQHDIEEYFLSQKYFYDRRKNYYKNLGKPSDFIITIPYLAQAVLSIGFSEPDNARARPSSTLRDDAKYRRIFNDTIPLMGYLWMAKLQKSVDIFIRETKLGQDFKVNMRFYLSMLVAHNKFKNEIRQPSQIKSLFSTRINSSKYEKISRALKKGLDQYMSRHKDFSIDRVAKSKEFVKFLIDKNFSDLSS